MPPSNADFLYSVQSGGLSDQPSHDEFISRFNPYLRYVAAHYCARRHLHPSEVEEILQAAFVLLFSPNIARFDPARGEFWKTYLRGLVRNAARSHARNIRQDDDLKTINPVTYPDQPVHAELVADPRQSPEAVENRELADQVLASADDDVRILILRTIYGGESPEAVAASLGIDRTTIGRRLRRFYEYAAVRWQSAMAG